jgi:hypothetical protein
MNGYMNMALGALLGTVFVLFSVSLASEGLYHSENPEKPGFVIEGEEVASAEGAKEEAPLVPIAAPIRPPATRSARISTVSLAARSPSSNSAIRLP